MAFDHESLEIEASQVLNRHAELLKDKEGCARAAATLAKVVDSAARPKTLRVEADVHQDGVVILRYPEGRAMAILGSYRNGEWLDEMNVDVKNYDYIQVRADNE